MPNSGLPIAALALLISASAAFAQANDDVKPERAPPAQQAAPAEKVGDPLHQGLPKVPETTGQTAPFAVAPGAKTDNQKAPDDHKSGDDHKTAADIKANSDANVAPNKSNP